MSNVFIAILFALGGGTWIYSKMYSRTGGNSQNALITAALSGGLLFLLMLVILWIVGDMITGSV